jgi:heme exporter protein D
VANLDAFVWLAIACVVMVIVLLVIGAAKDLHRGNQ